MKYLAENIAVLIWNTLHRFAVREFLLTRRRLVFYFKRDVSLEMRQPRKFNAPLCPSREYTRTVRRSIIIGRSAKPKSVRESSLYGVCYLIVGTSCDAQRRARILVVRRGRLRLRADVNYYWQFHETNSLLALSSVHTRRDVTRRNGLYTTINCIRPCGLRQTSETFRDANQDIGTISREARLFACVVLPFNHTVQISSTAECIDFTRAVSRSI